MPDFEADLFSALVVFGEGILYSPYRLPFPARKTLYNLTIFRKKRHPKPSDAASLYTFAKTGICRRLPALHALLAVYAICRITAIRNPITP